MCQMQGYSLKLQTKKRPRCNDECHRAIQEQNQSLRYFKKYPTTQNDGNLKVKIALAHWIINQSKNKVLVERLCPLES